MGQIGYAQYLSKDQLTDVRIEAAGNITRQALDFNFTQHLVQNAALLLHPGSFTGKMNGHTHPDLLVHGDTLQVNVQQLALERLILPVDDHHSGFFAAQLNFKDGVVAGRRVQNPGDLLGINTHRQRGLLCAINHSRNAATGAQAARLVFSARAVVPGLCLNHFL